LGDSILYDVVRVSCCLELRVSIRASMTVRKLSSPPSADSQASSMDPGPLHGISLDGPNRSLPLHRTIPRHQAYFQPFNGVPGNVPSTTMDGKGIDGWECFLLEGNWTPLFCPVVALDGVSTPYSTVVFCCDCSKWILYGGTVANYVNHARDHGN
jgi:hypothetical protein